MNGGNAMKKFIVKTPVETFDGVQMGIQFVHGEATIEDEKVANLFKNLGYEVKETGTKKVETPKQEKVVVEEPKKTTRKQIK
jgi:hypothetical protein